MSLVAIAVWVTGGVIGESGRHCGEGDGRSTRLVWSPLRCG